VPKKILSFFLNNFELYPPYQIIVCPDFLHYCLEHKVYYKDFIDKLIKAPVYYNTTPCIVNHLKDKGEEYLGTLIAARRFTHIKCGHAKLPMRHDECILSLIKRPQYVVATLNEDIRKELRRKVGVPILFVNNNDLVDFEGPSSLNKIYLRKKDLADMGVPESEKKIIYGKDYIPKEMRKKNKENLIKYVDTREKYEQQKKRKAAQLQNTEDQQPVKKRRRKKKKNATSNNTEDKQISSV